MSEKTIDIVTTSGRSEWLSALDELLTVIHPVDRNAVQIWFRFFPIELKRWLDAAEDRDKAAAGIVLKGDASLANRISTSHYFLYGHRYWPTVKAVIDEIADADAKGGLREVINEIAGKTAEKAGVDRSLTMAIAAVGAATLGQVGIDAFRSAPTTTVEPTGVMKLSPDKIVAERQKDDSQGIFGFLRSIDRKYSVDMVAEKYSTKFPIILEQQITQASAKDGSQNWQQLDDRCWEGPIPVECTSASCGTCWIGVLGGEEKMSDVTTRERRAMKVFGYDQPETEKPFLRLACQTKTDGNASIVVPPWNAVFGNKVYGNIEAVELEPNTTSAAKLRETIASAMSDDVVK